MHRCWTFKRCREQYNGPALVKNLDKARTIQAERKSKKEDTQLLDLGIRSGCYSVDDRKKQAQTG